MYKEELKEYYDKLFPLLYIGFSATPYARYTSSPSFENQYFDRLVMHMNVK